MTAKSSSRWASPRSPRRARLSRTSGGTSGAGPDEIRMYEHRYTPVGRIATAIYRETIEKFLWRWEGTDADFREPSWPAQWTHEFPLALGELLDTLDREAALLAAIAGTSRTGDVDGHELAMLSLDPRTHREARPRTAVDRPPAPLQEAAASQGRLHRGISRPVSRQRGGAVRAGLVARRRRGAYRAHPGGVGGRAYDARVRR